MAFVFVYSWLQTDQRKHPSGQSSQRQFRQRKRATYHSTMKNFEKNRQIHVRSENDFVLLQDIDDAHVEHLAFLSISLGETPKRSAAVGHGRPLTLRL